MKYIFILNPISGEKSKKNKVVSMISHFMENTADSYEIVFTSGPGNAAELAREAAATGVNIVVAAGGDGTINETAQGLIHSESALGVIPLGSGNGFARSLNIPLKLENSIKFLLNPTIKKVDIGKANERYFFGVCGIGYDANIGKKFQEFGVRGPIPYFLIGVKELLSYKPEKLNIKFENKSIETSALLVAFANTRQYGNGAVIAPEADPQDGLLDICILNNISFCQALLESIRLFKGTINKSKHYSHYRCKSVEVKSSSDFGYIHMDGEPFQKDKKLSITLLRNALNVCAPFD